MPEGHKTHFIAKQHTELLVGDSLQVTSPQGRFRGDARRISGTRLEAVEAVGKHLFYGFEGGRILHIHLGRYGKFRQHSSPPPRPVGQVRARLKGSSTTFDLTGPTTCRVIDQQLRDQVTAALGPDPLAGGRKSDVWKGISRSNKPIGALLLDQSVVAGVGNIFRAEVLFETMIDPETAGSALPKESFDRLWRSLTRMMKTGLRHGRIISVTAREAGKPLREIDGKDRFRVYGKSICPRCGQLIESIELASRRLYVCTRCQRRPESRVPAGNGRRRRPNPA
jgi:endonuclease-8